MAKKKKQSVRKPKYGLFSSVGYIYRLLWKYERTLAFAGVFTVPLSLALAAFALYTPSAVLAALEKAGTFSPVALVICGILLSKLLVDLLNNVVQQRLQSASFRVMNRLEYLYTEKRMDMDWHLHLDPEVERIGERAVNTVRNNGSWGVNFPIVFANVVSMVLQFFLFGTVVSLLNPLIILLLAAGSAVVTLTQLWMLSLRRKWQDEINATRRKINYLSFSISQTFRFAKDIRLYQMRPALRERSGQVVSQQYRNLRRSSLYGLCTAVVSFLVAAVRDGGAYVYLIYRAAQGGMDASTFLLYFSAITSMAGLIGNVLNTYYSVVDGWYEISDFREFLELPDESNRGEGVPVPRRPFSVEFRHVSYRYPQGEKKVLDDVSFAVAPGEKIALVGVNGAGKTTLTLLLCGFLRPNEGEVLLDGLPVNAYNRDELIGAFGLVPQDYHLLPLSIACNIAATEDEGEIDAEKLDRCIELAGLREKIDSLPNGVKTSLNRTLDPAGVELSGGETQKLLLARLLYKDPPCLLLDEPTAALDPLAEDRMYRRYREIASHATSVFISHRLASTRFCDRILLLDGARIAESGTHDELMAAGGKYRELFDVQSKYYREEAENHETR